MASLVIAETANVVFLSDAVVCLRDVVAHFDAVNVLATFAGF
jgi:hypothetical protein